MRKSVTTLKVLEAPPLQKDDNSILRHALGLTREDLLLQYMVLPGMVSTTGDRNLPISVVIQNRSMSKSYKVTVSEVK